MVQSNTQIGTRSILNTGCSVDHDSLLLKGVHICPGARLAGSVKVGPRSFIGIGSSIIQGISVGSDVVVGAGASVVRDVGNLTVVGVPALLFLPHNPQYHRVPLGLSLILLRLTLLLMSYLQATSIIGLVKRLRLLSVNLRNLLSVSMRLP